MARFVTYGMARPLVLSFDVRDNRLRMEYRDLLEHLKDKDPSYYYSDVLIPNGKTLKDFIGG